MKNHNRNQSAKAVLLLLLCLLFALFAQSCGSHDDSQASADNAIDQSTLEAIAEDPADKTPLEVISDKLATVNAENQMFGTVSRIKKAGGGEYTADLRVYEWLETEGDAVLTDTETYDKITLTKDTTVVYATNSEPHGVVMSAEEFQTKFVEGDFGMFVLYLNENGKVDLIYSYSLVEQEE